MDRARRAHRCRGSSALATAEEEKRLTESDASRNNWRLDAAVEAVCIAAASLSVLSILHPALIFSNTITAGGDMTSHVGSLQLLLERYLPEGRLGGWTQGNLAGYPLFQFYFPFPFLVMSLLSLAFPFHVAFKLGAVLAPVLYPAAAALALRRMRYAAPVPACGALLSLVVLLNDRQSVWGGNLQSLLAGEICYGWGYLFFPLFLAELWRAVRTGRVGVAPILLEIAMGLSHGYALLFGGLASLFLLRAGESPRRALAVIAATHAIAFLALGAWIIPLIAYMPFTTAFNFIWVVDRADDLLPDFMLILAVPAFIGALRVLSRGFSKSRRDDRFTLWAGIAVLSILIYRIGYRLHVVDIRFLPFWLAGLCFAAAAGLEGIEKWPRARWALPLALAGLLGVLLPMRTIAAEQWARWNFEGLEARSGWKTLSKIADSLRGDLDEPRVFYEHGPDNTTLGTVRIFESLPYLSNRATLEGIYIQSSLCSPFVYYIQSELSNVTSAALPDYHYSHPDVDAGLRHLDLFNARTLVIRSKEMRRRLEGRGDVKLAREIGSYSIYERVGGETGFARPVREVPYVYAGLRPKEFAYGHFIKIGGGDPSVVLPFGDEEAPDSWPRIVSLDEIGDSRAWRGDEPPPVVTCELGEEEVRIRTTKPGWPIRLAMAFHPRWKAEGARLFAITPAFLLVVPDREEVVLRWTQTGVEGIGLAATFAGLVVLLAIFGLSARRWCRKKADEPIVQTPTDRLIARLLSGGGVIALVGLAILPSVEAWRTPQEWQWWGEEALKANDPALAVACFDRVVEAGEPENGNPSMLVKGLRWRAMAAEAVARLNGPVRETPSAVETLPAGGTLPAAGSAARRVDAMPPLDAALRDRARIIEEFPESEWALESADWCGRTLMNRGDYEGARRFIAAAAVMDPGSPRQNSSRILLRRLEAQIARSRDSDTASVK